MVNGNMQMEKIKQLFLIFIVIFSVTSCDENSDPYEEGMHWDYSIICEGGFKYKRLGDRGGVIQLLNSDGTPLRCGKKRY